MKDLIESAIINKKAFVKEHHSFARSAVLLVCTAALGLIGVFLYHRNEYLHAAYATALAFASSIDFYFGKSYYSLHFPKVSTANMLFKVKDVYFVGTSLQEAQMFASFYDIDASQVEQVPDAQAFKFD
jgi:hypothetical protein